MIDQSLVTLDERVESVSQGIKAINDSIDVLAQAQKTPTSFADEKPSEDALVLRKHAAMITEWESVQKEVQVLREELKEDKWLTVFRTVTDQADGMMSSLEKAVNRCQVRPVNSIRSELALTVFGLWNRILYGKYNGEVLKRHCLDQPLRLLFGRTRRP